MAIQLCTYNIEWFNNLFNNDNSLKTSDETIKRLDAISQVLQQIDADLIGIVEAPNSSKSKDESTITKLETFASNHGLRTNKGKHPTF